MKKFVKYIFYAVVVLLGLYILFWSRSEHFTSPNPILTQADFDSANAWSTAFDKTKGPEISKTIQYIINWLNTSNLDTNAMGWSSNVPSTVAGFAAASPNDQDALISVVGSISQLSSIIISIQDYVKSSSEPPSYSDFYNKIQQIVPPGAPIQTFISWAKNPTPTITNPTQNTVYNNPVYYAYKYYYGVEPTTTPSQKSTPKPPPKPCSASYSPISGGTVETRCFTK